MMLNFPRSIPVTDEEEAILLRALTVHRDLLRNLCGKKYGTREHRAIKAKRLETIEALMARIFPGDITQAEALDRALAAPPDPNNPWLKDPEVARRLAVKIRDQKGFP